MTALPVEWATPDVDEHPDVTGKRIVYTRDEKDRLKQAGWTCHGYGAGYVLAPPGTADGEP